jgi:NAD dependent epimerase/dehydratase family enzyme
MKVLLTGGRGFVASHLEIELELKGFNVTNVSRSTDTTINDILESKESFDFYIHTAGISQDSSFAELKPYIHSNVDLTKKVFTRFETDEGARRFIFFSSTYALKITSDSTAYAKSKALAEEFLKKTQDSRIQILRPALICLPPEARGILGPLQSLARKGIGLRFPKGFAMSWISLKTISNTIITSMNQNSFRQELNMVEARADLHNPEEWLMDFDIPSLKVVFPIPLFLLKILFALGQSLKLPLNKHFLKKLQS